MIRCIDRSDDDDDPQLKFINLHTHMNVPTLILIILLHTVFHYGGTAQYTLKNTVMALNPSYKVRHCSVTEALNTIEMVNSMPVCGMNGERDNVFKYVECAL